MKTKSQFSKSHYVSIKLLHLKKNKMLRQPFWRKDFSFFWAHDTSFILLKLKSFIIFVY